MKYKAVYTNQARKGIRRASDEMRKRLKRRMDELCEDPYLGVRLTNSGDYRDKVGVYRIIYNINKNEHHITIQQVEPRDKVYKHRDARQRHGHGAGA